MNSLDPKEGSHTGLKSSGIDPLCLNIPSYFGWDLKRDCLLEINYGTILSIPRAYYVGIMWRLLITYFFQCGMSRQVWTDIKTWLGFTREVNTIKAAVKWSIKEAPGTEVQAVAKRMSIACSVYCIWKHRNAKMFEGKDAQPASIIRDIKIQTYRSLYGFFPNFKDL